MLTKLVTVVVGLAGLAAARIPIKQDRRSTLVENGVKYHVFDHAATGARLQFVNNSGLCETTQGVNQYSGYLNPGGDTSLNMFFWFFEARNSPETAPLASWFNGGPGCSSMIGLFQENGPCYFEDGASSPTLNPKSWNNNVNMVYIDQPFGTGFSTGSPKSPVTGADNAAPYVWQFVQAFYAAFPQYKNRDFGIFTESYGGRYGPAFADYFAKQNAAITSRKTAGVNVPLKALGINNGWLDPGLGYQAYIDFAYSNEYNSLISKSTAQRLNSSMPSCLSALKKCASSNSDRDCSNAANNCQGSIESPLTSVIPDVYDVRDTGDGEGQPSEAYESWLGEVRNQIGATKQSYQECANTPYYNFANSGDIARSSIPELADVVSRGITTLVWAGDADWICNWYLSDAASNQIAKQLGLDWPSAYSSYTVNGQKAGTFKTSKAKNFSFLRVFGAGHEVPFYQPDVALQAFEQTMLGQSTLKAT